MVFRARLLLGLPLLLVATLAGCPGSLSDFGPFRDGGAAMCGDVVARIITPQCAKAGCHVGAAPSGGLDMSGADIGKKLIGKMSATCGGVYIDLTTPEQSLVYTKLADTPKCGARMPSTGAALSAADKQCMLDWIKSLKTGTTSSSSTSSGMGGSGGAGGAGGNGAGGGDAGPG